MSSKIIKLKDNRRNEPKREILSKKQFDSLERIAKESAKQLTALTKKEKISTAESTGIVIYPEGAKFKNKDENHFIKLGFPKDEDETNKKVDIYTSNIVGVLKCNDVTVEVHSRFDEDNKQYFFSAMLSHAFECGFSEDLRPNFDNSSMWEIMLVFVFADSLEKAYQQGLFKQYVENKYNDFSFKGRLDAPRHLKLNIPFQGRIAWSNREYSYDNPIIKLIHHSINTISAKYYDLWTSISSNSPDLPEIERVIREASPTYSWNTHYHLLQECHKPINHPLFSEYESLRKICLMILREEGVQVYDTDEDEVYGILFDCAWLWESFVYKRLLSKISVENQIIKRKMKFIQPTRKAIFEGKNSPQYHPDFITAPAFNGIVLDAKYKDVYEEKDNNYGDNSDIYQAISYQLINDNILTGLVFPVKNITKQEIRKRCYNESKITENPEEPEKPKKQFWYIPFWVGDTQKESFYDDFENECNAWITCLTQNFEHIFSEQNNYKININ